MVRDPKIIPITRHEPRTFYATRMTRTQAGEAWDLWSVEDGRRVGFLSVVDDGHLMGARGRNVDLMMRGHRQDAGCAGNVGNLRHDAIAVGVEDHRPAGVHVIHVDPAARRFHALVVESIGGAGQRDLADQREP